MNWKLSTKMLILPKTTYKAILVRIPAGFFADWQADSKIQMEIQGTHQSLNNLENEEQSWRTHTSRFKRLGTGLNLVYALDTNIPSLL